ncbi:unnamed protein product [Microthlaspi erraticum]|uniref:Arabidopsis retrotransposon Orf1 C-terminal domain-containing protein n=1 Tax=Microthlaspi erraticum TaxID=1685480 RepID=A0A6D2KZJ6_9BRAS|nr:unnamed protein product [Microthlaspi erraticum]
MVTFRQLEILFGFTYGSGSPVLRYVHKALANTFFARKATGTINEGEVKLLDMGIKPIISRTRDGKKIRGDRAHAGNLMPLLEQLQAYKQEFKWTREGLLHQVGWTSSFARPTFSLSTRSWMGGSNSSSPSLGWPSKLLLPNPELTTVLGGTNIDFRPLCTH